MADRTVLLVDDDSHALTALATLLRSAGHRVAPFVEAEAFAQAALAGGAACAILDIRMPGMSGLDLQRLLAGAGVFLPLIFLTGHGDIRMCAEAMKNGASDFLTKPFREQDVLDAVVRALDRSDTWRATHEERLHLQSRYATLSTREKFVMAGVAAGKLSKVLAGEMGLSEITVKLARAKMMRKMRCGSVAELAVVHHKIANLQPADAATGR